MMKAIKEQNRTFFNYTNVSFRTLYESLNAVDRDSIGWQETICRRICFEKGIFATRVECRMLSAMAHQRLDLKAEQWNHLFIATLPLGEWMHQLQRHCSGEHESLFDTLKGAFGFDVGEEFWPIESQEVAMAQSRDAASVIYFTVVACGLPWPLTAANMRAHSIQQVFRLFDVHRMHERHAEMSEYYAHLLCHHSMEDGVGSDPLHAKGW